MLVASTASSTDRQADVERAVLDLCPKVFAGTLSLSDQAALSAIGYTPAGSRQTEAGAIPRAVQGTGTAKIVISGDHSIDHPSCAVWFGGPDNDRLLKQLRSKAKSVGYKLGPKLRLGDGTAISKAIRAGSEPQAMTIIEADAGGELDDGPATTIILMAEKG